MRRKAKKVIWLAALVCAVSLVGMIVALTLTGTPQFTPPPFDETAELGTPAVPDGLGWGELDAQAFRVSVCGVFAAQNGTADVYLTSPASNAVWLKLRVIDGAGKVLGETGLIRPGEYVRSVALDREPESGEVITLKLMAYEPETYHSAGAVTLNTTAR